MCRRLMKLQIFVLIVSLETGLYNLKVGCDSSQCSQTNWKGAQQDHVLVVFSEVLHLLMMDQTHTHQTCVGADAESKANMSTLCLWLICVDESVAQSQNTGTGLLSDNIQAS